MNDSPGPATSWSPSAVLRASASTSLPTAAAALAASGIPIFPCVPGAKQPLTSRGFHDATAELAQVREWWRRTPEANIGLPTGAVSGVVVVDVDVHAGGTGYPAFERARAAGLVDAWALLVRTPSGGLHAYFPHEPGREQRSWQVPGQHIDFRGDGGYIVAPPSRIAAADGDTRSYAVIAVGQNPPRALDAHQLRRFLEPPRPVVAPTSLPAIGARPDKLAAWVATRPEGARNQGLFWAACRMVEDGHRYDATLSALGEAARAAGLPEREAETTIRSAYRIAARRPPASSSCPTRAVERVRL